MSRPSKYFNIEELTPPGFHSWNYLDQRLVDLVDKLRELNGAPVRCNFDGHNHRGYREPASTVGLPNSAHRRGMAADLFFYDTNGQRINKPGDVASADAMRARINQWKAQGLLPQLSWMEPGVTWIHVQVSGSKTQKDSDPDLSIQTAQTSPGNMDLYIKPVPTLESDQSSKVSTLKPAGRSTYGLAIGNEIMLSSYGSDKGSVEFFKKLFTKAGLDNNEIAKLEPAIGISEGATDGYVATTDLELTNEKCTKLLYEFIDANSARLKSNFGLILSEHPIEINTALVSYIFDVSFANENVIKDIANKISEYLVNKKYDDLANLIELQGEGKIASIKNKRINEARLIRLRKSDTPNYSKNSRSEIAPDSFFNGKQEKLDGDVEFAKNNIRNVRNTRSIETNANSSPGPRDETYQEITKDVSDSFSDLMSKQQLITDSHHNELDSEYLIRVDIKNRFANLTRNLNKTYAQVESDLEKVSSTDNNRIAYAYSLFPFGNGLFYDVKMNAVNRAQYRIKKLKNQIEKVESEMLELGVTDLLSISTGIVGVSAIALARIMTLKNEHGNINSKLINEIANFNNLMKDLNHYNKKNVNI